MTAVDYELIILIGGHEAARRVFKYREPVEAIHIGSSKRAGIVVEAYEVASYHFSVSWDGKALWAIAIDDHHTDVNGETLGKRWEKVESGAEIEFGMAQARLSPISATVAAPAEDNAAQNVPGAPRVPVSRKIKFSKPGITSQKASGGLPVPASATPADPFANTGPIEAPDTSVSPELKVRDDDLSEVSQQPLEPPVTKKSAPPEPNAMNDGHSTKRADDFTEELPGHQGAELVGSFGDGPAATKLLDKDEYEGLSDSDKTELSIGPVLDEVQAVLAATVPPEPVSASTATPEQTTEPEPLRAQLLRGQVPEPRPQDEAIGRDLKEAVGENGAGEFGEAGFELPPEESKITNLLALFRDRFSESALGKIPKRALLIAVASIALVLIGLVVVIALSSDKEEEAAHAREKHAKLEAAKDKQVRTSIKKQRDAFAATVAEKAAAEKARMAEEEAAFEAKFRERFEKDDDEKIAERVDRVRQKRRHRLEKSAVEAAVNGDYLKAHDAYLQLSRRFPKAPYYADVVKVLRKKLKCHSFELCGGDV